MNGVSTEVLGSALGLVLSIVLGSVTWLSMRRVSPGERVVAYRFGKARRDSIAASGRPVLVLLPALAEVIPEVLRRDPDQDEVDGGATSRGEDQPAWRRRLRNPYRLPIFVAVFLYTARVGS